MAVIKEIEPNKCTFFDFSLKPSPPPKIDLLIGISRPPTMKKIFEHGTTFGVSQFSIFKADLSDKSYLQSPVLSENQFTSLSKLGLSQGAKYDQLPTLIKTDLSFYDDQNANIQKFFLDPYAENFIDPKELDLDKKIIFAIGPERGFTKNEVELLKKKSFIGVKIASSVLRVEHAVYTVLAQMELVKNSKT
jgi:RsmE family RNA methyltransferase